MILSYIVAMERNQVIGKDNQLPWHLPADLAHFKKVTTGHTIVMGRKTYESIGRPLPNRRNVIVTRDIHYEATGCEVVHTKEAVIELCKQEEECFIIGGSDIFSMFWDEVQRLYLTYIHADIEGDTYFPKLNEKEWCLQSVEQGKIDEKNRLPHEYRVYERI